MDLHNKGHVSSAIENTHFIKISNLFLMITVIPSMMICLHIFDVTFKLGKLKDQAVCFVNNMIYLCISLQKPVAVFYYINFL